MRLIIAAVLGVLLGGCAEFTKLKVDSDGMYRFKQHPIVVWAPDKCLLDMFVNDTDRSVDFVTGRGYWTQGGQYAVQVFEIPKDVSDKATFVKATERFYKDYMVKDRAPMGLKLVLKESKALEVNGRPAYQAISVDEGKAVFVATSVLQNSRITIASLVYPLKTAEEPSKQIPWKCYNTFLESVKETR